MKYICSVCGYVFEETDGQTFESLELCPRCMNPKTYFEKMVSETQAPDDEIPSEEEEAFLNPSERYMDYIHQVAATGDTIISAMDTQLALPNWDDIYILGAQLNPFPLDEHADTSTTTIIGKNAAQPMELNMPVYITHMSFGALSQEVKLALAQGSALAKTAMCSGEGGILPQEMRYAYKYIFEYVPNKYSATPENLRNADAIEIKIGQGTKPGMGGHLPGEKVTQQIARIRNKPMGQDIISPSKFEEINSKQELKALVDYLRTTSLGRPIGIKIAAGRIEQDLEYCVYAQPDFITIDGRGGATGASPQILRDSTSIPTVFALARASKYLKDSGIDLVITGGLRVSSDFAKAIALGADAIAIGSAALMAAGCNRYRVCADGNCPRGIATQNPNNSLDIEATAQKVYNYLNCTLKELKAFARITGHHNIHDLSIEDLCTINSEISNYTDIKHV